MRYMKPKIVFQEVPDETSLVFPVCGCPRKCPGCHSPELQNPENGNLLSRAVYDEYLEKYRNFITCVCFFGGDHEPETLVEFLRLAQKKSLKTCLYTGAGLVSSAIHKELDYLKTGPWISKRGGLESPFTNQKLINIRTGEVMNDRFRSSSDA